MHGVIRLDFAGEERAFCVARHAQIFELQEKCADKEGPSGPLKILARLTSGAWLLQDVRDTIRLGLIGGGMAAPEALKLTRQYVDERPWAESVPVARAVLLAAAIGIPEDPLGKPAAEGDKAAPAIPADASSAHTSTAPARRSASRRGKAMT